MNLINNKIYRILKTDVLPRVGKLLTDDVKFQKLVGMSYRMVPFPLRFVLKKERFVQTATSLRNMVVPA